MFSRSAELRKLCYVTRKTSQLSEINPVVTGSLLNAVTYNLLRRICNTQRNETWGVHAHRRPNTEKWGMGKKKMFPSLSSVLIKEKRERVRERERERALK